MNKKRIGIIVADYPLGVLLDTTSMAIYLAKEGFLVDIFIDKYMYESARVDFDDKNIRVITVKAGFKATSGIFSKRILNFNLGAGLDMVVKKIRDVRDASSQKHLLQIQNHGSFKEKLLNYQKCFFPQVYKFTTHLRKYINRDYLCLIGVEPRGLLSATLLAQDHNIPVIYQNMELLLADECKSDIDKVMKNLERECNQKCLFTIIQDQRRAQYLIKDNQLDPQKIKLLPNSLWEDAYKNTTDYLYKKLNIPKDKKIILYAGNLNWPSMSLEVAQLVQKWPDNYVLVLHTWAKFGRTDEYTNKMKEIIDNKRVYLSVEFLESRQFPELISSSAIGLVFYRNLGPNYYEIGSACNKLIRYLNAGVPVITIDFPSLKEKIEPAGAGVCVSSPELIGPAIETIMQNYQQYRAAAFKLYEQDYTFSKNFQEILATIKKI
ncbi:MAG: hypothetical protein EXS48_02635 [Candidatus Staskawiczbacteria bacterium]|nr:hypothetical protein [Candidatus Staskawiczbacteria bacterium]